VVEIADLTTKLQSAIIVNVSVGRGYSNTLIENEMDDGTVHSLTLADCIDKLFTIAIKRGINVNNILFPRFTTWHYTPYDRRYARNT
jgi:hypothetical protein